MIVGYAYHRDPDTVRAYPAELRKMGAKKVFVDHRGSERRQRAALFEPMGLREGDTLLIFDRGHLGTGREPERFEKLLAERGVTIEVRPLEKPEPKKPGPAPMFKANYKQEAHMRHYWHGPFQRQEALRQAAMIMRRTITPAMLNKHLGPRSKPKPWLNEPPEGDD